MCVAAVILLTAEAPPGSASALWDGVSGVEAVNERVDFMDCV